MDTKKLVNEKFNELLKQYGEGGMVSIHAQWLLMKARRRKQLDTARRRRITSAQAKQYAEKHGWTEEMANAAMEESEE